MGGLLCLYKYSFWRLLGRGLVPRSRQRPTVHRKVGLGCTNRQLVRGLFSYKNPTHQPGKLNTVQLRVTQRRANFSAGYKRDLALDDKSVSSTAVLDQQALPAGHPPPFEKGGRKLFLYLKVLASPTFLVMPRLSQYSKIATANLREAPIRSRISARVICPFLATCSLAISSALL